MSPSTSSEYRAAISKKLDEISENQQKTNQKLGIVQRDVNEILVEKTTLFENSPDIRFRCDAQGRNILTSKLYRSIMGMTSSKELDGYNWQSRVHSEDLSGYKNWAKNVLDNELSSSYSSLRLVSMSNDVIGVFSVTIHPVVVVNGKREVYFDGYIDPSDEKTFDFVCEKAVEAGIRGAPTFKP